MSTRRLKPELVHPVYIILVFTFGLFGCAGAAAPTPASQTNPTATPQQSFSYQVHVTAKDTGKDLRGVVVKIEVAEKAPLDDVTDINGIARILIPVTHIDQPGVLIVQPPGYRKHRQHIDLTPDVLPDTIQLEPEGKNGTIPTPTPTFTSLPPTATVTDQTAFDPPTATLSPLTPTPIPVSDTPTPVPSSPTAANTATPITSPTSKPASATDIPELPTSAPPPLLSGKIAVPLVLGPEPKVYIANINGKKLGDLGQARQPRYAPNGTTLVVNGDGGGLNKLRTSDAVGQGWVEIGDPALSGHSHPAWSPDGTQVIYDDDTMGCRGYCIYRRFLDEASGEGERIDALAGPILDPNSLFPLWTTDDRFVFRGCNSWSGGGQCGLWLMEGNFGEPQRLTENFNHIPTDVYGDWLLYSADDNSTGKPDDWNVIALNLSTEEKRQLTNNPAADGLATFSPDGSFVAFLSNREGLAVWYTTLDGGTPQKMFNIPQEWGGLRTDGWTEEHLSWGK